MNKKILKIMLILTMLIGILSILSGCGEKAENDNKKEKNQVEEVKQEEQEAGVNGTFVKYKNNTYYWKLTANSREEVGLHAQYQDILNAKNDLIKIDEKGKEEVLITEKGSGEIFIVNDKIFLSYVGDEYGTQRKIYSIDLNGENKKEYTKGEMKYIVGDYIYCQTNNNGDIFAINTKNDEITEIKKSANIVGCEDEIIYYTEKFNYDAGTLKIGTISEETDNGIIATFSKSEFENYSFTNGALIEVTQLWKENDKINIYVGYRAGSANMIQELFNIKMDENGENLEKIAITDAEVITMENEQVTEGVYYKTEQENGEYVNHLMYVDEKTKERKEIADEKELYKKFNLVDDDEHMLILYSFGIVEDDIYVVLDYGEHYAQEDIGWRYAYKRMKTICFKYNTETKEISEVYEFADGKNETNEEKVETENKSEVNEQKVQTNNTQSKDAEENTKETTTESANKTQTSVNKVSEGIQIGNYTIKYGTYKGEEATANQKLVINSDGTASFTANFGNGFEEVSYTYKIEDHDFSQDIVPSYEKAVVFYNLDGSRAFGYYPCEDNVLTNGGIEFFYLVD